MSVAVFGADTGGLVPGASVVLDGPEGHHAATVRRLRVGERVLLTDGAGTTAQSVVTGVGRDCLTCRIDSVSLTAPPAPSLVIVQALPKGDRGETAVQTLTEVGVDVIVPWAAARCVTRWHTPRSARALERWRSAGREAAKQSRRSHWPQVTELATTSQVAALLRAAALGVVLHEAGGLALAAVQVPVAGDVVLVVGPEGGVDESELATFAASGAAAYRLGDSVLRTSTAGTVAAAVLLARTGRWST